MVLIMFEGLHDIDWASMEHAYGSAEEVPALLWALRSPQAEERRKAGHVRWSGVSTATR
jgi:hypothetical protein